MGFYLPHLPMVAPRRYRAFYQPEGMVLPVEDPPTGAPEWAFNRSFARRYRNIPADDVIDEAFKRSYLQASLPQ